MCECRSDACLWVDAADGSILGAEQLACKFGDGPFQRNCLDDVSEQNEFCSAPVNCYA